jgi:hypothetical protein
MTAVRFVVGEHQLAVRDRDRFDVDVHDRRFGRRALRDSWTWPTVGIPEPTSRN